MYALYSCNLSQASLQDAIAPLKSIVDTNVAQISKISKELKEVSKVTGSVEVLVRALIKEVQVLIVKVDQHVVQGKTLGDMVFLLLRVISTRRSYFV